MREASSQYRRPKLYHVQSVSEAKKEAARTCPEVETLGQTKKKLLLDENDRG